MNESGNNGLALVEREFRLYQEIRVAFRRNAHCEQLMDCLSHVITVADREKVEAVFKRDGEMLAASELLWQLRRRPNWVEELIKALRDPYVAQGFVADEIEEKAQQIQVVIKPQKAVTENGPVCLDGLHCGETEQRVAMPGESLPDTELWEMLVKRIVAKELLIFLKSFTLEEEEYIIAKIEKDGNIVATRVLLKKLLAKNHGLDNLIDALSEEDLGLQDLAIKLKEFRSKSAENNPREGACANAGSGDYIDGSMPYPIVMEENPSWMGVSVKDHAAHVMIQNINLMMKKAANEGNFPLLEKLCDKIDCIVKRYDNGSIIITLNIGSIESLDTLQSLYEGGVLSDVIHKDLLTDAKMKFVRESSGHGVQNIDFGVNINPFDLHYCRMNILKNKVPTLPNNSLESVAVFKLGSRGMTKEKFDEFRLSITPSLRNSMEDCFVQERMTQVYDLLQEGDITSFTLNYLELLYHELFEFTCGHACKGSLQDIGSLMSRAVRFSGSLVNGFFQFELTPTSPREDGICLSAHTGGDGVLMPRDVWDNLLEERILVQRRDNVFTFRSILLQDFLMMPISKQRAESGIVLTDFSHADTKTVEHSLQNNYFHLFTNFLYQFFTSMVSTSSMEFTVRDIFHLPLQDASKEQIYELVVLATTAAKLKNLPKASLSNLMAAVCLHLFPNGDVRIHSEGISILKKQALRIFLSFASLPGFIDSVEVYKGFIWHKGTPSLSFSDIPVSDLSEVMTLLHLGSCLGRTRITVHTGEEGRLVNCQINVHRALQDSRTDSEQLNILSPGRVFLNLSKVMLSPLEDVDILLKSLPMLTELHCLNLTKTGLPARRYTEIIRAMRSTNIQELILNGNGLANLGSLGLINIPLLHKLDLDECRLGDDGLQLILSEFESVPNLMELSLSGNGITNNALLSLYSALKHCKKLKALRVHENKLEAGCGMLLSAIIHDHSHLEILNLSELHFSPTDIGQITKVLQQRNITKINFWKCELSLESSKEIFRSLKDCKYLQHLDFSLCSIGYKESEEYDVDDDAPMVTDDVVLDAGEPFLSMLNASNNWDFLSLWDCGLDNSIVFKTPDRLYCLNELGHLCLQQNKLNDEHAECIGICLDNSWHNLQHLNLRKNSITDEGVLSLQTGIMKNKHLKELYLDMNRIKISTTIINLIHTTEALPNLLELDLSYNIDSNAHQVMESQMTINKVETIQGEGYFEFYRGKAKIIV